MESLPPYFDSERFNTNAFQSTDFLTKQEADLLYMPINVALNLGYILGVTPGVAQASKALVLDSSLNIATINSLTSTTLNSTTLNSTTLNSTTLNSTTCNSSYINATTQIKLANSSSTIFDELAATSLSGVVLYNNTGTNGELNSNAISFLNSTSSISTTPPNASITMIKTSLGDSTGHLVFHTKSGILNTSRCSERMRIQDTGFIGINTFVSNKQLSINNSTGQCLRLIYNNTAGTETLYTDLTVDSSGNYVITPILNILSSKSLILTSDTSYLSITSTTNSVQGRISTITSGTNQVTIGSYSNHQLTILTNNTSRLEITNTGFLSVNTTRTNNRQLTLNHTTGQCLRFIYNDSATLWSDLWISSVGNLVLSPYNDITTTKSIEITSNTKMFNLLSASTLSGYIMDFRIFHDITLGTYIGNNSPHNLIVMCAGLECLRFDGVSGNAGFNTTDTYRAVTINSPVGYNLRLLYNNANYSELLTNSAGDLLLSGSSDIVNIVNHNGSTKGLKLGGTLITSTATQLNYCNVVPGTATASKALVLDSSLNISTINSLTSTTLSSTTCNTTNFSTTNFTLNGTVITSSGTELNYNDITTLGIAQASKTLTSNSSLNTTGINLLNCTTLQVNSSLTDSQVNIQKDQNDFTTLTIKNDNTTLTTAGTQICFGVYRDVSTTHRGAVIRCVNDFSFGSSMANKLEFWVQPGSTSIGSLVCTMTRALDLEMASGNDVQVLDTGLLKMKSTAGGNTITMQNDAGNGKMILNGNGYFLIASGTTSNQILRLGGSFADYLDFSAVSSTYRISTSGSSYPLVLSCNNDANQIYINTTGVGIQNSSPAVDLDVTGIIKCSSYLIIGDTYDANRSICAMKSTIGNGGYNYINLGKALSNYNSAEISYHHSSDGATANYLLLSMYGLSSTFSVTGNNRVGVNTTTPICNLEIGASTLQSTASSFGYLSSSGSGTGTGFTNRPFSLLTSSGILVSSGEIDVLSDVRLKKNITLLDKENIINFMENIKPIKFNYKIDENNVNHIGFRAQDFIKYGFLELINSYKINEDNGEYKYLDEEIIQCSNGKEFKISQGCKISLNELGIIPLNTCAIQLLNNKIKELEGDLEEVIEQLNILTEEDEKKDKRLDELELKINKIFNNK